MTEQVILRICDDTILSEQEYYLRRYFAEIGQDASFEFVPSHFDKQGQRLVKDRQRFVKRLAATTYQRMHEDMIGNVSTKSRPYHIKHVEALASGHARVQSIRVLDCDDAMLTYFRRSHPLQEMRSWANIMLGVSQFCRAEQLSGHKALEELYRRIDREGPPKLSMHQKEIGLAIKLMLLSASRDSFAYGVDYCRKLMTSGNKIQRSMTRTLRIYRLLSYLFPQLQALMRSGQVCIRSLNAIDNELNVRERKRYKYKRSVPQDKTMEFDAELVDKIIEGSLSDLFIGLERYAANLEEISNENDLGNTEFSEAVGGTLDFDIGLNEHIERMIRVLNLQPSGPHGIIDLGDDEIIEHDDW